MVLPGENSVIVPLPSVVVVVVVVSETCAHANGAATANALLSISFFIDSLDAGDDARIRIEISRLSALCRESRNTIRASKLLDLLDVDLHKEAMESTPPPLPQTPPPAPRGGWWSRNWKWFVPTGCFTFIALGVLFVVCIVLFVFGVLKSTDVYKTAVAGAKDEQRVSAARG